MFKARTIDDEDRSFRLVGQERALLIFLLLLLVAAGLFFTVGRPIAANLKTDWLLRKATKYELDGHQDLAFSAAWEAHSRRPEDPEILRELARFSRGRHSTDLVYFLNRIRDLESVGIVSGPADGGLTAAETAELFQTLSKLHQIDPVEVAQVGGDPQMVADAVTRFPDNMEVVVSGAELRSLIEEAPAQGARNLWLQALELDPDSLVSKLGYARLLMRAGTAREAVDAYDELLSVEAADRAKPSRVGVDALIALAGAHEGLARKDGEVVDRILEHPEATLNDALVVLSSVFSKKPQMIDPPVLAALRKLEQARREDGQVVAPALIEWLVRHGKHSEAIASVTQDDLHRSGRLVSSYLSALVGAGMTEECARIIDSTDYPLYESERRLYSLQLTNHGGEEVREDKVVAAWRFAQREHRPAVVIKVGDLARLLGYQKLAARIFDSARGEEGYSGIVRSRIAGLSEAARNSLGDPEKPAISRRELDRRLDRFRE